MENNNAFTPTPVPNGQNFAPNGQAFAPNGQNPAMSGQTPAMNGQNPMPNGQNPILNGQPAPNGQPEVGGQYVPVSPAADGTYPPASMQSCGPAYVDRPLQPSPYNIPAPAPREKTVYRVGEAVFALLSLVFGFIFVELILFGEYYHGVFLGAAVLVYAFTAFVLGYCAVTKTKITPRSGVLLALLLVTGTSMLIFDNTALCGFTFLFDMALGMYWMYVTFGASNSDRLDFLMWADAVKAGLVLPFLNFGRGFAAFFSAIAGKKKDGEKGGRRLLYVLIGIALAVIPLAVVVDLLLEDEAFRRVWEDVIRFPDWDIPEFIFRLVFAIPVGCYLFGGLIGSVRFQRHDLMTRESVHHAAETFRFLPAITACTVMIPLCLVYVIYFLSQSAYFVSAFSGILPDGFTYAEYARGGFFELCRVSVIDLIVIGAAELFAKRDGGKGTGIKVCTAVLAFFTEVLMVIAQSKLILYIRTYGMTPLRVTTFWFTVVLGVIFALIIAYQFAPKMNFTRAAAICLAVLFCVLIYADTDAMIAKYNIAQFREGVVEELDTQTLYELGDGAVPYMVDVYDELPEGTEKDRLTKALLIRSEESDERSIWEWSIASGRAETALREWAANK